MPAVCASRRQQLLTTATPPTGAARLEALAALTAGHMEALAATAAHLPLSHPCRRHTSARLRRALLHLPRPVQAQVQVLMLAVCLAAAGAPWPRQRLQAQAWAWAAHDLASAQALPLALQAWAWAQLRRLAVWAVRHAMGALSAV